MARKALIVGIDKYLNVQCLNACEDDALAAKYNLEKNADGTPNYDCRVLTGSTTSNTVVNRDTLREACQELFVSEFRGDVLLYFSGHGAESNGRAYLATSDAVKNDWGVPMEEILEMALRSKACDILIIFDCCYSGNMGNVSFFQSAGHPITALRDNMTVIAACLPSEVAIESGGHGLFTSSLLDALEGGAADHLGLVTSPSIYAFIERRFDAWGQRPVYKSNASTVTTIRKCAPLIAREKLQELIVLFPTAQSTLLLDPDYEPEDESGNLRQPINEEKIRVSALLKDFRDVGLLKACEPGEQFFWVARRSHGLELTLRGREYWRLVKNGRI